MSIFEKSLKELDFVVFDLETTGLFPVSSKIIEIGAVKFNLNGKIDSFETLIDPEILIAQDSILIHGITDDMVKNKPFVKDIIPQFFDFIKDTVVIAHNSAFDAGFISYNASKNDLVTPDNIILDTLTLSKKYIKNPPNYKLGTLIDFLNIDIPQDKSFHRALFDAECSMNLFFEIVKSTTDKENTKLKDFITNSKKNSFASVIEDNSTFEISSDYDSIKNAIKDNTKLNIEYKRFDGEVSKRDITPISFIKVNKKIYLEAYCHLRNEKRSFRLNKILDFCLI